MFSQLTIIQWIIKLFKYKQRKEAKEQQNQEDMDKPLA
jgi:hypothetical protein